MSKNINDQNEAEIRLLMKTREISPEIYRDLLIRAETVVDVYKAQQKKEEDS